MASANGTLGLGLLMLVGGIALLAWAVSSGDAEFYLVAIIPVISGSGAVFGVGVLLFMVGLIGTFLGMSLRAAEGMAEEFGDAPSQMPPRQAQPGHRPQGAPPPPGGAEFGGVVFLGPIPIVFGKGPRSNRWMLVASIVFGILMIVFLLGLFL